MLLKPGTGNGERRTGVWELVYSGNLFDNSKWERKEKKRDTIWRDARKGHGCAPRWHYVLVRIESDG